MNIFYLDECPKKAVKHLYNKHTVKMVLETAQILCTAHQVIAEKTGVNTDYIPYRKAYYNHPCCVWARESRENYLWLYDYFRSIATEYFIRYKKVHTSWIRCRHLHFAPKGIPTKIGFTQPPQCMPDEYKADCSVVAYWNYYIGDKKHIANANESVKNSIPTNVKFI